MPWDSFRKMSDADLRALYRYLRTVTPAQSGPDPSKPESVLVASR
jgi:hypothetical protein